MRTQRRKVPCSSISSFLTFSGAFGCRGSGPQNARSIDPNLSVMHFSTYDAEIAGNFNQDRLLATAHQLVRRVGAGARVGWTLRCDVVFRGPANQRNRHSHGTRRRAVRRNGPGAARCVVAGSHRRCDWNSGGAVCGPFHVNASLWSERFRSSGLYRSHRAYDGLCRRGRIYPCSSRRLDRPDEGPPIRLIDQRDSSAWGVQ